MTVMTLDLFDAVTSIGEALGALCDTGPEGQFARVDFPVPEEFFIEPGRCSVTIRFDGIAADDPDYDQIAKSPSDLRFEVRIYHPFAIPSEEFSPGDDSYQYAQNKVLRGSSEFIKGIKQDRGLGDRLLNISINGSVTGDLFDPRSQDTYYGHEIVLTTTSF